MSDIIKFLKGFGYAFSGIVHSVASERNMRVHLVCMVYMYSILGFSDWFVLSRTDWALIFLANALVVSSELINTAIEKTVDLVTKEKHPLAKAAKDTSAGAVLVNAIFAVFVGISVLFQKDAFIEMLEYFKNNIGIFVVFLISLVIAFAFIFKGIPRKKINSN